MNSSKEFVQLFSLWLFGRFWDYFKAQFLTNLLPSWKCFRTDMFRYFSSLGSSFFKERNEDRKENHKWSRCDAWTIERLASIVMRLTTSRRTDWNDSFEEMNLGFILTQLVDSFTLIISILALFDRDNSQCRICELISSCKMWDTVMLIVGEDDVVLDPNDCWRRVCFYVTFNVHVVLERLAQSRSRCGDYWRKFDLQIDVTTITPANTIVSNTIVSSTIFLAHWCYLQNVSIICATA